jgi:RND family efflux transporter MFP subunit
MVSDDIGSTTATQGTAMLVRHDERRWSEKLSLAGAFLALSIGLGGCQVSEADPRTNAPLVRVATVRSANGAERAFTGVVSARVQSNLGFRVPGKITERLVDTGQSVKSGQTIMKLDPADLQLAIVAQTNAINAAKATAVQARADEARYRNLVAQGWVSHQRYEQAKSALDNAEATLAVAEANAQLAHNANDYSQLSADADGVVVDTLAEPGQVVAAGQTVVRLAHSGPREAAVYLPETIRPTLRSEATAVLYGDLQSNSKAWLRQLSDAADPSTRTYEARYVLEGAAANAPLGATVTIRIPQAKTNSVVEIPIGAVFDKEGKTGVWLLDQDKLTVAFRPIRLAGLGEETAAVNQGLVIGDEVVSLGAHLLHEGERVRITNTESASR